MDWTRVTCLTFAILSLTFGFCFAAPATAARAEDDPATETAHDLWVDAVDGDDHNDGQKASEPFRTIQRAADEAGPGTTVRILPGVYRESVRPATSGTASAPIVFVAEEGPGTVLVRGSQPSSSFDWSPVPSGSIDLPDDVDPANIYRADIQDSEGDQPPRFIVELDDEDQVSRRLPLAREPDWHVATDWRYHELWWTADGGSEVAQCNPSAADSDWNCDLPSRCANRLTDRNVFPEPDPRIDGGDLTTLEDLTGARLIAMDAKWGHYVYDRRIVGHDWQKGQITVEGRCLQDGGQNDPGLGWGTKYYVEDHPALLDSPGEWWYDGDTGRLYLWSPENADPATLDIEIARRNVGFDLTNRSHITLDGLTVELVNREAVKQGWGNGAQGNTVRNATLRYADFGVTVLHSGEGVTRDFTLEDSEIAYIDTNGLFISEWWDGAPTPTAGWQPSTEDIVIRGNEFHHLGFRTDVDNANGIKIQFANRLRFEDNHVHDVAHNGVQFLWSVIESDKTYGFSPSEIKTGEILVKDNLFEDVCQLTTDCGGLKFWGQPPHSHVFRDVLVTGNVFRDNVAWTYVGEQREGWWIGGNSCEVQGQAGFGLYLDYVSGVHAYRNIAYNNAYAAFMLTGTWRDGPIIFYNNIAANSLYGFRLSGLQEDTHGGSVDTRIVNNIIAGNEGYGVYQCTADENFGNMTVDHNLYYENGWRCWDDGGVWKHGAMAVRTPDGQFYCQTLPDIRQRLAPWGQHSLVGDPEFQRYDPDDHDLYDGSWPDFHLVPDSDRPTDHGADLPTSLARLLDEFGVEDPRRGPAYDIGRYEAGFALVPVPSTQSTGAGGTARYAVHLQPDDLSYPVDLEVGLPDSGVEASLSASMVTSTTIPSLAVTDTSFGGTASSGGWHTIAITGSASGFTDVTSVQLLVSGSQVYLPLTMQNCD
mgnify:CR=1 FL=1